MILPITKCNSGTHKIKEKDFLKVFFLVSILRITQVLGEDGRVTKQNIAQLVYLEAAIKESLRLYPAAAVVARDATADTKLRK